MWDLPRQGIECMSPALAGRFLTTAPPGKSHEWSSYWGSLICDESLLSCCFQDYVFIFGFLLFDMPWCGSLEFILLGIHWASWIFIFMYLIKFGNFSVIISSYFISEAFFFSFWDSHSVYVSILDDVHRSLMLTLHFFSFFSFHSSDSVISIVLSSVLQIVSSAC